MKTLKIILKILVTPIVFIAGVGAAICFAATSIILSPISGGIFCKCLWDNEEDDTFHCKCPCDRNE